MKGRQQEKPLNFISFSSENLRKNNKKDTIYFDQNRLGNFVQLLKEILNNYGSKSKEGRITANQHHGSEISSKANDKDSKEKIEPKFHEYVPLGKPKFFECDERTIKIALVRTNKDMRRFVKIKQANKWNDISNTYHIDVVTAGTLLKSLEAIEEIISKFKENAKNDVFSSVNPKEKLYTCKFSDSMKNYYVTLEVGNLQGHHKHAFYIWIRDEKLDSSVILH
uniref:Uncharacterized protein n=1 Tax=Acrobeloides nanus TaxID=290746 RepID=A0A914CUL1_9BILA